MSNKKRRSIKSYRRTVQVAVMIGIFVIPFLNVLELHFIKGTFISMDVGDLAMSDPLAIFQAVIASKEFSFTMLASVVVPLLAMVLLGRIWCSWMCPYYTLVEFIGYIRSKLKLKSTKPSYSNQLPHRTNRVRFLFLLFGVFLTGVAAIPLLNLISAPGVISSQALVLVKSHYLTLEIGFILVLLILEFFYYRFWCRYLCPTGTFLSLFKSKRGLHIGKMKPACSGCKRCQKTCPMLLDPFAEGDNLLCFNCGDCIDACPDNRKEATLKFKIGR